ncbi:GNAT family N-acetyltransferase [Lachnospiraceae bacterium 48-42]|jgi:RimJ/RimL family protein N-acetyltransferase
MMGRDIFAADGEFIICPISNADRCDYVELHRQLNGEASLYLNPVSRDMMWEQILKNADSVFSLFTENGDYCGSIELQQPDSNIPEIGIDLLENKRNQGIAPKAVRLFAGRVCEIRKIDYFLIRISSNNSHSKYVFEKMGAIKIGEEETAFSRFVEEFSEIAEKEGQDLERYRDLFGESIDEVVYRYRLNPNKV